MSGRGAPIRHATVADLDRIHEICLRTADAGQDATTLHSDPSLPGHVWAAPYVHHAPEHAFVVVDADDRAGGYVLGARDSREFEATLERSWWPELRSRYPLEGQGRTEADQATVALLHEPPVAVDEIVRRYPSHLHIDLLPEFQGRGHGRRLIETVVDSLTGVPRRPPRRGQPSGPSASTGPWASSSSAAAGTGPPSASASVELVRPAAATRFGGGGARRSVPATAMTGPSRAARTKGLEDRPPCGVA